jgi:hypothetical protein
MLPFRKVLLSYTSNFYVLVVLNLDILCRRLFNALDRAVIEAFADTRTQSKALEIIEKHMTHTHKRMYLRDKKRAGESPTNEQGDLCLRIYVNATSTVRLCVCVSVCVCVRLSAGELCVCVLVCVCVSD